MVSNICPTGVALYDIVINGNRFSGCEFTISISNKWVHPVNSYTKYKEGRTG